MSQFEFCGLSDSAHVHAFRLRWLVEPCETCGMANRNHMKRSRRRWLPSAEHIWSLLRPIDPSQLSRRHLWAGLGVVLSFGAGYAMRGTATQLGLSAPGGYALATTILGLILTLLWAKFWPD